MGPGPDAPVTRTDTPAQPQPPAQDAPPDTPPGAEDGVAEGDEAAEEKSDEEPEEVVCNCPDDEKDEEEETEEDDGKPAIARAGGDENTDVIYAEAGGDATREGLIGSTEGQVGVGMVRMDHAGHFGEAPVGGSHKLDVMTADARATGGIVHGAGFTGQANAAMVKQSGSLFVGGDENNPLAEAGGEYQLMSAEAKANALVGSDGSRAGLSAGLGAVATAAKADGRAEFSIPIPFTNWTIAGVGKAGVSAGSLGAAGQVHALKDLDTGRYHGGIGGELAALVGLKLDLGLSIGPAYDDRTRTYDP